MRILRLGLGVAVGLVGLLVIVAIWGATHPTKSAPPAAKQTTAISSGVATASGNADPTTPCVYPNWPKCLQGVRPEIKALLAESLAADTACRGSTDDEATVARLCAHRDEIDHRLNAAGWCYGEDATSGADAEWKICQAVTLQKATSKSNPSAFLKKATATVPWKAEWQSIEFTDQMYFTLKYREFPPGGLDQVEADTTTLVRAVLAALVAEGRHPSTEFQRVTAYGEVTGLKGETGVALVMPLGRSEYNPASDSIHYEPPKSAKN